MKGYNWIENMPTPVFWKDPGGVHSGIFRKAVDQDWNNSVHFGCHCLFI
jgi:hypothetical protein